jgi:hypothetical protein
MFYDPEKARSKVDQDCDLDFLVLWIRIQLFYIKTELDFDLDAGEKTNMDPDLGQVFLVKNKFNFY